MTYRIFKIICIVPCLALASCLGGSSSDGGGGSSTTITIPNAYVSCSGSADCADESANTKNVYVAIFNVSCATITSGPTDPLIYGSTTATCASGTCTGTVSSWVDGSTQQAVTTMTSGSYSLAAYIDTGGTVSEPDTGEPWNCSDSVTFSDAVTKAINSGWTNF